MCHCAIFFSHESSTLRVVEVGSPMRHVVLYIAVNIQSCYIRVDLNASFPSRFLGESVYCTFIN